MCRLCCLWNEHWESACSPQKPSSSIPPLVRHGAGKSSESIYTGAKLLVSINKLQSAWQPQQWVGLVGIEIVEIAEPRGERDVVHIQLTCKTRSTQPPAMMLVSVFVHCWCFLLHGIDWWQRTACGIGKEREKLEGKRKWAKGGVYVWKSNTDSADGGFNVGGNGQTFVRLIGKLSMETHGGLFCAWLSLESLNNIYRFSIISIR